MMYSQDENGVWWYYSTLQRTRCKMFRCTVCDIEFPRLANLVKDSSRICCTRKCSNVRTAALHRITRRGANNPQWKGGRKFDVNGYVKLYRPDHPNADSHDCVAEHRLVMEKKLGRLLVKGETVHHRNGVRSDNRPRNLELWVSSHPPGQKVTDILKWAREIIEKYGGKNAK